MSLPPWKLGRKRRHGCRWAPDHLGRACYFLPPDILLLHPAVLYSDQGQRRLHHAGESIEVLAYIHIITVRKYM